MSSIEPTEPSRSSPVELPRLPAEAVAALAAQPVCGYRPFGPPAPEPTALAAMALLAAGQRPAADVALDWLADRQQADGSLRAEASAEKATWPTGWAMLAWQIGIESESPGALSRAATGNGPVVPYRPPADSPANHQGAATRAASLPSADAAASRRWADALRRAAGWALTTEGHTVEQCDTVGHNPRLRGWAWVETTHSWVEPTAIHVLALRRCGLGDHPRCREAVAMLLDRMLSDGGWNYGNTTVLGNRLHPHVQPTGLALAALAGIPDAADSARRALSYLDATISPATTTASLCHAILGMTGHGRRPAEADAWLASACRTTLSGERSPYALALVVLAAAGDACGWFDFAAAPTARRGATQ